MNNSSPSTLQYSDSHGEIRTSFIAHRGASFDAPENTLQAFRLALEQSADGVETDIHLTRDGEIVCIHDPTTTRTSGRAMTIANSSWSELRELDVGTWKGPQWEGARIPLLRDALDCVPSGRLIFIEIKCGCRIFHPLKKTIEESKLAADQIRIISFDIETVAAAKRALPELKTYWLTSFSEPVSDKEADPSAEKIVAILRETGADGVDCVAHAALNRQFTGILRDAHMEIHVWTVDDPASAQRFISLGVDSITSNRAGWLKTMLL